MAGSVCRALAVCCAGLIGVALTLADAEQWFFLAGRTCGGSCVVPERVGAITPDMIRLPASRRLAWASPSGLERQREDLRSLRGNRRRGGPCGDGAGAAAFA